jgi:hypothetical protein
MIIAAAVLLRLPATLHPDRMMGSMHQGPK